MKFKLIYLFLLLALLTSCFKEDSAMLPIKPGNMETVQIEIGYPYTNQVYYDCGTNKVVSTHEKYEWDLAFECDSEGFHVLLNTAKGEFVANLGSTPFSSVQNIDGVNWLWDAPSGNLDSTGIGDWRNRDDIYILDLQFDADGHHLGYKKLQFLNVNNTSYTFKFANLNGSEEVVFEILKHSSLGYIHFSFENGGQSLELEPHKDSWDLLFSNHYHKFDNLPMPFVLTQVLTNKANKVLVAEANQIDFLEITLSDTGMFTYSDKWDEIGYDWKIRNSQDNSFEIDPNKSFIVKTTEGIFFKIRFIDFYNNLGSKGYPKFEIQKL